MIYDHVCFFVCFFFTVELSLDKCLVLVDLGYCFSMCAVLSSDETHVRLFRAGIRGVLACVKVWYMYDRHSFSVFFFYTFYLSVVVWNTMYGCLSPEVCVFQFVRICWACGMEVLLTIKSRVLVTNLTLKGSSYRVVNLIFYYRMVYLKHDI